MVQTITGKKKKWYKINASEEFKNVLIGESLVSDPNTLIGKNLEISPAFLIHDPKKSNFKIKFKIREIKGEEAFTDLMGYNLPSTYIKRAVRPGKSIVEDSFKGKTKDNLDVVAKPFLITRAIVSNSIKTSLRKKCREYLIKYLSEMDYKDIMGNLLNDGLQRDLRKILEKTYPLTICQLRVFERK